jgi:hypothetical protein
MIKLEISHEELLALIGYHTSALEDDEAEDNYGRPREERIENLKTIGNEDLEARGVYPENA